MGINSSQQNQNQITNFLSHPILKQAIITPSKKIILSYKQTQKFQQWKKRYDQLMKLIKQNQIKYINYQNQKNNKSKQKQMMINKSQEHSLFLPKIQQTKVANFCGIEKQIKLIYDLYPYSLYEQILNRKKINKTFTQQQLWYLLYQLLKSSHLFEIKRSKVGDIRPKNIFINAEGYLKLINTVSFPQQSKNYHKSLKNRQITYLAPQQLTQLQLNIIYPQSDPSIAQNFSIGLTIMDAALLIDSQKLYTINNQISFKNYLFNDNLVLFKKTNTSNLSQFFIKTVLNLLEPKSYDRPSPGESLAILLPYENQILDLQEFAPNRDKSKKSLQNYQKLKK